MKEENPAALCDLQQMVLSAAPTVQQDQATHIHFVLLLHDNNTESFCRERQVQLHFQLFLMLLKSRNSNFCCVTG